MRFHHASFNLTHAWSSPFVRWQGSLADVSSIELAMAVTNDALTARHIDKEAIDQLVLGCTVPQSSSFYSAPWLASAIGMPTVTGPHIAQACATSVASIVTAASRIEIERNATPLVVTTDRTSNGPLLVYPRSDGMGGTPQVERWVVDNFAADPATGQSMLVTAENVVRDGAMTSGALNDLTMLRWEQYKTALANERQFQRKYMQSVNITRSKKTLTVDADEGVRNYTAKGLASLRPTESGHVITHGMQTHPADGCAGMVLGSVDTVRGSSTNPVVVSLLSAAFARVDPAQMPKAATPAALRALSDASLNINDVKFVVTHNPFAANDLWFSKETGFPLERMNPFGCSLIYGHPQGPTGMRGIIELAHALSNAGGGVGLFTGCAAGDTGAALVLRVD